MSECNVLVLIMMMAAHPWPMFQKDIEHTGQTAVDGPSEATLLWQFNLGSTTSSSPTVAEDGTIYIGTNSGYLIAVGPDGKERWRYNTGAPINAAPAILANGDICMGTSAGKLVAVTSEGSEKWNFAASGQFAASSSPIVDGSSIYIAADSNLYCINSTNGKQQWVFRTSGSVDASPAKSGTSIYIVTWWPGPNYLHCVTSSGTSSWQKEVGGGKSSPTVSAQTVSLGSNDSYLYSIHETGTTAFKKLLGGKVTASPAISPSGEILVGAWDSTFYCLNNKGDVVWEFPTKGIIESSAAVDGQGTSYFGCADSTLYAVSSVGQEIWHYKTGHRIISSPAIGQDGTVYIGCWDQKLYAVGPGGGVQEGPPPDEGITLDFSVVQSAGNIKVLFTKPLVEPMSLKLVDASGRIISTRRRLDAGTRESFIECPGSSGVYFAVAVGSKRLVKKVILH